MLVIAAEVRVGAHRLADLVGTAQASWEACVLAFERSGLIDAVGDPDGPWLAGTAVGRRLIVGIAHRVTMARADAPAGCGWDGAMADIAFPIGSAMRSRRSGARCTRQMARRSATGSS